MLRKIQEFDGAHGAVVYGHEERCLLTILHGKSGLPLVMTPLSSSAAHLRA